MFFMSRPTVNWRFCYICGPCAVYRCRVGIVSQLLLWSTLSSMEDQHPLLWVDAHFHASRLYRWSFIIAGGFLAYCVSSMGDLSQCLLPFVFVLMISIHTSRLRWWSRTIPLVYIDDLSSYRSSSWIISPIPEKLLAYHVSSIPMISPLTRWTLEDLRFIANLSSSQATASSKADSDGEGEDSGKEARASRSIRRPLLSLMSNPISSSTTKSFDHKDQKTVFSIHNSNPSDLQRSNSQHPKCSSL